MNCGKIRNFGSDMSVERKVADFLDKSFYPYLSSESRPFERATDLSDQYAGIDLRLGRALVDEKSKNTCAPNQMNDWMCSLEMYQRRRDGEWVPGWFADGSLKTTHYLFEYRFEDGSGDISACALALFPKDGMKEFIGNVVSPGIVEEDAKGMKDAMKGRDDVWYRDPLNVPCFKLTKSREGAAVLVFRLSCLQYVKSAMFFIAERGKSPRPVKFGEMRKLYTQTGRKRKGGA